MAESSKNEKWPALKKDDAGLKKEIEALLTTHVTADPYSEDGLFAASIAKLPKGLRAMAATHWLDISLTLDSMTWHFGNFGEPGLVAATEAGLNELGLTELAACFAEAKDLMVPLLAGCTEEDGTTDDILEKAGLSVRASEIDKKAWQLYEQGPEDAESSLIYAAWIRYAREHPENVFDVPLTSGSKKRR